MHLCSVAYDCSLCCGCIRHTGSAHETCVLALVTRYLSTAAVLLRRGLCADLL
jgi:hypothetical protein